MPRKGTYITKTIFCVLCASLWLGLSVSAQSREAFLDDLQQRSFRYFWEQADPQTGLVPDRARVDGSSLPPSHQNVASSAATGFGLTSLCIAADRNWISKAQALERTRNTLRFFDARAYHQRGWFYHWLDAKTGERRWNSEVSSIDTALLLGGVLTVRQCFREDQEIVSLASRIYRRVDFRWMLNGHQLLLSHGWKPESGFLKTRWDTYSEDAILYLLAIGSPTFPINAASWYALWRDRYRYEGHSYFTTIGVPLFMHQYSHAWVDFRNRRETRGDRIDYFKNSVSATLAHRAFCMNLSHDFPAFGPDVWGITASDSAKGYLAWGGPPRDPDIDGTLVPSAAGGSLMFTPEIATKALQTMFEKYGDKIYGKYAFVDAFNPKTGWIDTDVIGINVGIVLLSAENMRTGNVWRWFMQNREVTLALSRVGLVNTDRRGLKTDLAGGEFAHTQNGRLVHTGSPEPAQVAGYEKGHCVALRDRVRICKLLSEDRDVFLVEKDGKPLGGWPANVDLGETSDFVVLRADLDGDRKAELIVANHDSTSNGLGIDYWTIAIFPDMNFDTFQSPLTFRVEEYGDVGTFVATTGRINILTTRWVWGDDPQRKRGEGLYLVGDWWRYKSGRLLPLSRSIVARRYLDSFQRERWDTIDSERAPFLWLATRKAETIRTGFITGPRGSSERGVIQSVTSNAKTGILTIRFKFDSGQQSTFDYPKDDDYGPGTERYLGDTASGRLYPKRYLPPDVEKWLTGKRATLRSYSDKKLEVLWVER